MVERKKVNASPYEPGTPKIEVDNSISASAPLEKGRNNVAEDEAVPDNRLPPVHVLKSAVLKALREDRHSLAAAMEKSEEWILNENALSLSFNSPFESTFIEKECREIEGIIKKSLGWKIRINTVIKEKDETSQNEELEEQVELVRDVFRGTIINRSRT